MRRGFEGVSKVFIEGFLGPLSRLRGFRVQQMKPAARGGFRNDACKLGVLPHSLELLSTSVGLRDGLQQSP